MKIFEVSGKKDGRVDDGGIMGPLNFVKKIGETGIIKDGVHSKEDYLRMSCYMAD